ncbi:MAG: GNAT family N-acetyltransferase [Pseudothermotoga sp.]
MEQFKESFRTIGKVYVMYLQRQIAGFFWIEKRDDVLHIHALIIKEQFQGRGLGKQILHLIQDECSSGAQTLELGVHFQIIKRSNYMKALVLRKLSS